MGYKLINRFASFIKIESRTKLVFVMWLLLFLITADMLWIVSPRDASWKKSRNRRSFPYY